MGENKLKPCECGGKSVTKKDGLWFVVCIECGNEEGPHAYKREAAKAWNNRTEVKP